jgi:hypothetical protein
MARTKPSRTLFGPLALVGAVVVLLAITIVALVSYLLIPPPPPPEVLVTDPGVALEIGAIDPALAIAELGGVAEAEVVRQAIERARPNTALAVLINSPRLGDRQRAGDLLLLAERFIRNEDFIRAQLSYHLAASIATLSPDLPDTIRVDTFLQVGKGLAGLNEIELSVLYLDQAFAVAAHSPGLPAVYRQRTFEQLQPIYEKIGSRDRARASLNMLTTLGGAGALPDEALALPAPGPVATSSEVQAAEARRWAAAQIVAQELVERGGQATPESRQALQEALLAEDGVKMPFFRGALADAPQLLAQIGVIQAQIEWLSIKYRVARKTYGISLVPAWEAQVEQVRSELTKSYETMYTLYADLVVALPDASQLDKATEEALRREVLSGELGLYPNYPAEQRRRQLLAASEALVAARPSRALQLASVEISDLDIYILDHQDALATDN